MAFQCWPSSGLCRPPSPSLLSLCAQLCALTCQMQRQLCVNVSQIDLSASWGTEYQISHFTILPEVSKHLRISNVKTELSLSLSLSLSTFPHHSSKSVSHLEILSKSMMYYQTRHPGQKSRNQGDAEFLVPIAMVVGTRYTLVK